MEAVRVGLDGNAEWTLHESTFHILLDHRAVVADIGDLSESTILAVVAVAFFRGVGIIFLEHEWVVLSVEKSHVGVAAAAARIESIFVAVDKLLFGEGLEFA